METVLQFPYRPSSSKSVSSTDSPQVPNPFYPPQTNANDFMFLFPGMPTSTVPVMPPAVYTPNSFNPNFLLNPPAYEDGLYNSFAGRLASNFFKFFFYFCLV